MRGAAELISIIAGEVFKLGPNTSPKRRLSFPFQAPQMPPAVRSLVNKWKTNRFSQIVDERLDSIAPSRDTSLAGSP